MNREREDRQTDEQQRIGVAANGTHKQHTRQRGVGYVWKQPKDAVNESLVVVGIAAKKREIALLLLMFVLSMRISMH